MVDRVSVPSPVVIDILMDERHCVPSEISTAIRDGAETRSSEVVTHLPPTSEVSGSNPGPYVGKLVVTYQWSTVYSAEPLPTVWTGFLCPQNYP